MNRLVKAAFLVFVTLPFSYSTGATEICDRVSEIRLLPFKGEKVDDAAYNSLLKAGKVAIPCLIDRITDTTEVPDPRQAPIYSEVRVGDVAYFVLVDLANIDFVEMLPKRVQKKYKTAGVYAYFDFARKKQNREWLQRKLREWYRRN
jgi:hypothetical protein